MRVLQVFEPGRDGVFKHVAGLSRFLVERGVYVSCAYSSVRGSDELDEFVDMIRCQPGCSAFDLKIDRFPSRGDVSALTTIAKHAMSDNPDIIHAHSSKAGALCRGLYFSGLSVGTVYTPNAYFGMQAQGVGRRLFFNGVESVLGRYAKTIHVSESEARFARTVLSLPSREQVVIPNAVDCTRFRPAWDIALHRGRWGIPCEAFVIGTVARYSRQKDPITLYQALRPLMAEFPHVWFIHVGQGELMDEVSAMIESWPEAARIVRIPYLADTSEAYRAMDSFVLGSVYEGFAISALEAVACGLPLVLTRCYGNVDLDNFGLNAITWCAPGSRDDLTGAMALALTRASQGRCNHRNVAIERFSEAVVYGRILDCYRKISGISVI